MATKKTTTTTTKAVSAKPDKKSTKAKAKQSASADGKTAPAAKGGKAKLSALSAAARVLSETGQAMSCPELIQAMADKGYWTSPAGRTPSATLYAAIARELKTKGTDSRFRKAERGKFILA
jgi:hypothetical protein